MSSSLDRKIRGWKNRKRSIITSFSSITSFVTNFAEERDRVEVPVRLENLNALWSEFNQIQAELEGIEEGDEALETLVKERMEIEKAYYRSKGMLMFHARSMPEQPINQPRAQDASRMTPQVKLPDVKLPVFGGEFESWLNFRDMFKSLVHTSTQLSTIQKFYYLRSSLTGEALKLIQTIPICNEQYTVAWKMLEDHYSNPRRLQKAYIQTLFEFPCMKQESATTLHSLLERFEANVKILKQLGEQTEHWDAMLIHLLSTRLDPVTRRDWEEHAEAIKSTKFQELLDFLAQRVNVLHTVNKESANTQPSVAKKPGLRAAYHGSMQQCLACSNQHHLYQCETFSAMDMEAKERFIRSNQLCWNCLRQGHRSRDCGSEGSCRKCGRRHHTLVCSTHTTSSERSSQPAIQASQPILRENNTETASSTVVSYTGVATSSTGKTSTVLLATAIVNLLDENGVEHTVRALLDSGSEFCFATEQLCQRIKLQRNQTNLSVVGIGHGITEVHSKFRTTLRSRVTTYTTTVDFHVLPQVTMNLPSKSVDTSSWSLPTGLTLADPMFHSSRPIDVVLGAEVFFDLFAASGRISLGDSLPNLINSQLGWIVSGKTTTNNNTSSAVCNTATMTRDHRSNETIPTPLQSSRLVNDRFRNGPGSAVPEATAITTVRQPPTTYDPTSTLNGRFERFFMSLNPR